MCRGNGPEEMTTAQMRRSVLLTYREKSCFTVGLRATCGEYEDELARGPAAAGAAAVAVAACDAAAVDVLTSSARAAARRTTPTRRRASSRPSSLRMTAARRRAATAPGRRKSPTSRPASSLQTLSATNAGMVSWCRTWAARGRSDGMSTEGLRRPEHGDGTFTVALNQFDGPNPNRATHLCARAGRGRRHRADRRAGPLVPRQVFDDHCEVHAGCQAFSISGCTGFEDTKCGGGQMLDGWPGGDDKFKDFYETQPQIWGNCFLYGKFDVDDCAADVTVFPSCGNSDGHLAGKHDVLQQGRTVGSTCSRRRRPPRRRRRSATPTAWWWRSLRSSSMSELWPECEHPPPSSPPSPPAEQRPPECRSS